MSCKHVPEKSDPLIDNIEKTLWDLYRSKARKKLADDYKTKLNKEYIKNHPPEDAI